MKKQVTKKKAAKSKSPRKKSKRGTKTVVHSNASVNEKHKKKRVHYVIDVTMQNISAVRKKKKVS